jgi:hypothetical protein
MEFDEVTETNGLPILSYSLEIDYDLSGNFVSVIGYQVDQMALSHTESGLVKSKTYAARYRSRNTYGWSNYSPVAYLLVATEPGESNKPTFVSADGENIYVTLNLNTDNRGSVITDYELSVSTDGLTYTALEGYDGVSESYTINKLVETMESG